MHSRIIRRPNLGHNLKGKFKFRCIICTHTIYDASELRIHKSFINYTAASWWRPLRLMSATADERCVDANIFRFHQKYHPRPQASAEDRYTVLTSAASAVKKHNDLQVSTT